MHFDKLAGQQSILQDSAIHDREDSDGEPAGAEQDAGAALQNLVNEINRGADEARVEQDWEMRDVVDLRETVSGTSPILPEGLR